MSLRYQIIFWAVTITTAICAVGFVVESVVLFHQGELTKQAMSTSNQALVAAQGVSYKNCKANDQIRDVVRNFVQVSIDYPAMAQIPSQQKARESAVKQAIVPLNWPWTCLSKRH